MRKFTYWDAQPVMELIGKYESRGSYEIVYGGIPRDARPAKLTSMTIDQVIKWQREVVTNGAKSSAVGFYQIIRKTLEANYAAAGVLGVDKFDKQAQDKIGMRLLAARGFQSFLDGKIDWEDAAVALAKEWASLPVPVAMQGASRSVQAGQSYYSGDGLNKAHATVREVEVALGIARERHRTDGSVPVADAVPVKTVAGAGLLTRFLAGLSDPRK